VSAKGFKKIVNSEGNAPSPEAEAPVKEEEDAPTPAVVFKKRKKVAR